MTEIAIEVSDLSKHFRLATERRDSLKERFVRGSGRYEEFWALRDVSFQVERGTTFGLIGHNGSGKSTLLKILAGIYRPTSGSVAANGRISALLELGAGFHGELTGRENVYLNGAILGLSRKQIDASMDKIIDFAGIGDFIDSPVKVYSSGMYVRLGFSIAVTVDPEILIVDEIIAVGDEEFQRKCFDHLFELRRQGTTIVLVSHSLGIVSDLCDNALWLDHGKPRAVGEVRDVVDEYLQDVNKKEAAASGSVAADAARAGAPRVGRDPHPRRRVPGRLGRHRSVPHVRRPLRRSGCTTTPPSTSPRPCSDWRSCTNPGSPSPARTPVSATGRSRSRPVAGMSTSTSIEFALQPGMFLVTTAVVDRGHSYDYVDRGFELRVRADSASAEPGLTRLFGSWSLHQESAHDRKGATAR